MKGSEHKGRGSDFGQQDASACTWRVDSSGVRVEVGRMLQRSCKTQTCEKPSSTRSVGELRFITPVVPKELVL